MSTIEIVEHQDDWAEEFRAIAKELRSSLGDLALRIDHIGSTAVKGLPAKNIIDLQVTVSDLNNNALVDKLCTSGYPFRSDVTNDHLVGWDDASPELRKRYFREKEGARRVHIHVREEGRINQQYPILFRDFLRSNALVREAYAVVKMALAEHFYNDVDAYYAIKDPYMDTIYEAAKLWALQNNWLPDTRFI